MLTRIIFVMSCLVSIVVSAMDEPFNITMKLLQPIVITELSALIFPNSPIGSTTNITVLTTDSGAASFSATGSANVAFTKSVVETNIILQKDGASGGDPTKEVTVDTFTLAGPTSFNASGSATGLKVGATAHILSSNIAGDYFGQATFRIIY